MGHKIYFLPPNERAILVGVILVVVLVVRITQYVLMQRRSPGTAGHSAAGAYGLAGGAICSTCGLPFALPLFSIRLGFARLARCPHCGHWALAQRRSPGELQAAEAARLAESGPHPPEPDSDAAMQELLDRSRYTDKS